MPTPYKLSDNIIPFMSSRLAHARSELCMCQKRSQSMDPATINFHELDYCPIKDNQKWFADGTFFPITGLDDCCQVHIISKKNVR